MSVSVSVSVCVSVSAMTTPILEARLRIALDAPHRALDASASIHDLLGFRGEDFTGGAIALRDRIHADDQDIAERLFSPADAPCAGAVNLRLRQADGRIRCVKVPYVKAMDLGRIILDLCLQDAKSLPRTLTDAAATVNFRAMMENTDDYIYFKDRNHVFTGASQTLVSLCDPAEHWTDLLGQTDYDVFPEVYADTYYRLEKRVFSGEPAAQEIQGYLTKDGRQGWVDNRKYPIRDAQGEIVGLYGIARDVTRQRRLQAMLLAIADFVSLDHGDGCFERMVAFAAGEFLVDYVHIGLLQPDDAHVRIVAGWRDGAPVAPGHVYALAGTPCEHVLRRSHQCHGEQVRQRFPDDLDLAELDAEAYVGEPIADASGQVLGLIVLVSRRPLADVDDIAAGLRILAARAGAELTRRQHRHSLQQANERLQLILDHAPIGIWLQDGRGRMLFVNKAFCDAMGINEAAFLALPHYASLIPEAYRQQCIDSDVKALSDSGVSVTYQRLPFVDGRIHDLRVIKAVKRDAQGRAVALVGLSLDITEELRQERSLRQERDYAQNILNTVEAIIVALDTQGRITLINRKGCELLGYAESELLGRDWFDTCLPASFDVARVREVFRKALAGELAGAEYFENPVRTRDGGERLIAWHNSSIRDRDGRIIGGLSAGEDITDLKAVENALKAKEALLRTVIDELPDILILKDAAGRFLLANQTLARLYGSTPEAMVGKDDADFGVPETMAQGFRDNVRAIMARGETTVVFEDSRDATSGEIRHFKSIKKPFKDAQGNDQILVIAHDITDIVEAQQRVADNEKLLREVLAIIHEGIWDWHVASGRVTHNAQWYASLRVAPGDVAETLDGFIRLIHPDDRDLVRQRIEALLRGETDNYYSEHRLLCGDGSEIWVHDRGRVVERDAAGRPVRVVGSFADISYQRKHQQQLEHVAHYDALSGLPNRVLLADRLQQAMVQAQRRGEQLAVVYLDLDGFKAVNDQFGHDTGDRLLVTLADRMKRALREGDTLARLGGDEFVAVLVDLKSAESCLPLLIRLLKTIAQPVHDVVGALHVSASLGVSFYPQAEPIDADQLLRQADQAMYQAKLAGKNRYHLFDAAHDRDLRGRHATIERLGEALARQEFVLHYQPKVDMRAGRVIGVEALVRWQHPQRGLLTPAAFLPALENHALMVRLGDWVIDTALAQTAAWRDAGLALPVSVNVDALQLSQADFVDKLRAALARHPRLRPGDLELEVLETSALQDMAGISRILAEVQALGVRFSLDDFGTGYSSLTYLKRLPVDTLKIDQSFVRDMLDDPEDLAILEGVIGLAGAFRRMVIAEGVECEAHGEMLLHLGCDLGQGYAIARPMPAAQVPDWLQIWRPGASWLSAGRADENMQPAVFALAEHRAWVRMLYRYLNDETAAPPPLDHHHCNFGHWLDTRLAADLTREDCYTGLTALHDQVHHIAVELVGLKQRGEAAAALARFREIEAVREALSDALRALITAMARG